MSPLINEPCLRTCFVFMTPAAQNEHVTQGRSSGTRPPLLLLRAGRKTF